jgi:leucyl aminopeptidase (aminopeptidase T)
MTDNYTEREVFAKTLIEQMFKIKRGETVAITIDSGSDKLSAEAITAAVSIAGGLPLLMNVPKALHDGQAGVKDWPAAALKAALCKVDVWIEMNSTCMLYSDIWEAAIANKVRYLVIGDSSIKSLARVFNSFNVDDMKVVLEKVKSMAESAKIIRITSENGTDVSYETNHNYPIDLDDGDFSMKVFGTAPGYVNVVPKQGSMNGKIVFDTLMFSSVFKTGDKVTFEMKDGKIAKILGGKEAEKYKGFLSQFNDENVYKISHNMFGLNPGVRELCGEIVEDERIWGGVDFGFGHTSPIDMPPAGQQAETHFDGVVAKANLYFDGIEIFKEGEVVHPNIKSLADKLISE